ncbi:MAG: hypothetical protein R2837_06000 [Aliarcobacter sp.]
MFGRNLIFVLINAVAVFKFDEKARDFKDGIDTAKAAIISKSVHKLETFIKVSQQLS